MRLSEAMRLGAMLKPQAFEGPSYHVGFESHTCALAAAAEAYGDVELDLFCAAWKGRVPYVRQLLCPVCDRVERKGNMPSAIVSAIAHLNDEHRWTREQIADWVETVEHAQADAAVASVTASHD